MNKFTKLVSTVITGVAMVFAVSMPTLAATQQATGSGDGIKIAPVRSDISVNAGSTQTVTINVQNVTSQAATYSAVINDFVAGKGENGQPSLLLDSDQYAPSHSLKRFVAPIPNFTLAAGATKTVNVSISVPKGAAGGGYYGAVRFVPSTISTNQSGAGATLAASVGSLILVKVPGDIKDDLTISSFDVRTDPVNGGASSLFTSNKSLNAVVRFQNSGNIQEQPFGKILLMKGKKVLQTSEINLGDPAGNVLPDSIRRFSVPLTKVGKWGKYTIQGNFGYASNGQLLSASSTFYVVPVPLIIAAVVIIVLIIIAIIGLPRAVKRYNRSVLRKAGRR